MKNILEVVVLSLICMLPVSCSEYSQRDVEEIRGYITSTWDRTVHYNPKDTLDLIGLPYPYTVPSVDGMFQEMYYWDTFFTNEGLIRDGRVGQAKNNTDDMLYMVERFGKMLNGNRTWYMDRSQPPYLSMMVRSVYESTGDKEWLAHAYDVLKKEYAFWQTERMTPCGLNRYSSSAGPDLIKEFVVTGGRRLGTDFNASGLSEDELYRLGRNFAAEAESGWDFNPRFDRRCEDFCPVDLNSNLYRYETNFAYFAGVLGLDADKTAWSEAAAKRKTRIMEYCYDVDKRQFYDYDYVNDNRSDVVSAAIFSLMYNEVIDKEYAACAVRSLKELEFDYGVSVCEDKQYGYSYQWSWPNTWPPATFITISGLHRYGYGKDAGRIAEKYIATVVKSFKSTGRLWEKYNVMDGTVNVSNEYEMPDMLGWSAGTFIFATDYLNGK